MAAIPTDRDEALDERSASLRVSSFLEGVETKRRRTRRVCQVAAAVGAIVATVAFLTSMGVVHPGAGRLTASAGALLGGVFAGER